MKKSWIVIAAAIGLVIVGSVAVWKSSGDDSRRQGALGNNEDVALSWRGDWAADAEYARGNVVSYEGISYVATGEKLAEAPQPCTGECAGWTTLSTAKAPAVETEKPAEPVNNITGYELVTKTRVLAPHHGEGNVISCPPGKKVFGGGVEIVTSFGHEVTTSGYPSSNREWWWTANNESDTGRTHTVTGYAICAHAA